MKIVIDARMISWTGIGRYTTELLRELANLDNENEYSVLFLKKDFDTWQAPNDRFTKVMADFEPYSRGGLIELGRQIDAMKPDLVHFPHFTVPPFLRSPYVVTVHDLTLMDYKNIRGSSLADKLKYEIRFQAGNWVTRRAIKRAEEVISPTKYTASQIHSRFGIPDGRLNVTPESAEISVQVPEPYQPLLNQKFILYVGNAYPYKNLEQLVDVFALLNRPDYKLVFTSKVDFFYKQVADYADKKGVSNLVLTDFVSDGQLAWLYQHAACYVFPSLSEGFGLPGLEAMHYDLPVASSNATCLPEVYGDAAHYFDPNDPKDMAEAISDILDMPELRKHLISAGHDRLELYSWRKMAEETLAVYEKALR